MVIFVWGYCGSTSFERKKLPEFMEGRQRELGLWSVMVVDALCHQLGRLCDAFVWTAPQLIQGWGGELNHLQAGVKPTLEQVIVQYSKQEPSGRGVVGLGPSVFRGNEGQAQWALGSCGWFICPRRLNSRSFTFSDSV